jgi:hypothetical protein
MYIGLHAKYRMLLLSDFNKIWKLSWQFSFSKNNKKLKLRENPTGGKRALPCGWAEGADVTKVIITFLNFANAPNENRSVQTQALIKMRNEVGVMMEKQIVTKPWKKEMEGGEGGDKSWKTFLMFKIFLSSRQAYRQGWFWRFLYLLTYLLTPSSTFLLEKLGGSQLVKNFLAFYGTRKFIIAFTNAQHLPLPDQCPSPSYLLKINFNIILPSQQFVA